MGSLRWGLTMGAYNKYKHLFAEPLPKVYETPSQIAQAAYIRDALRYASMNHLPGGNLYGKVKISAQEIGVVILPLNDKVDISTFPVESVFSLMAKHKELASGYEFASTSTTEELNGVLNDLGFHAEFSQNHYILKSL